MRVLLTGNRGYIGTVMGPFLQRAGHEVLGVDTDLYRRSTFGDWKESVPTTVKDLRELQRSDLLGFDPQLTFDINHLASVRLAELARAAGVKRFAPSWPLPVSEVSAKDAAWQPLSEVEPDARRRMTA